MDRGEDTNIYDIPRVLQIIIWFFVAIFVVLVIWIMSALYHEDQRILENRSATQTATAQVLIE